MKKHTEKHVPILQQLKQRRVILLFFCILFLNVLLRFYQLEQLLGLGWDQVRDAWAMQDILINGNLPLLGPRTGIGHFFLGPAYYYLLVPFYYLFHLDPIAGGYFAGMVSCLTLCVLFLVTRKIFSDRVALISCFLYAVSSSMIIHDRVPWNVDFVPFTALTIYYSLYAIWQKKYRWMLVLALCLGFSFHVHFTAIFYPFIIVFCLLYIFFTRKDVKVIIWMMYSLPLLLVWFIPMYLSDVSHKFDNSLKLEQFFKDYYHGFHLRFMLFRINDVFIEYEEIVGYPIQFLKFAVLPFVFIYAFLQDHKNFVPVLFILPWFIVPLIGFTLYSGPISDYYFAYTRPFVVITLAYILSLILLSKITIVRFVAVGFMLAFFISNTFQYYTYASAFITRKAGLTENKKIVRQKIKAGEVINFSEGDPNAYLYYIYTR